MSNKWRVFLSYRGQTKGEEFSKNFYDFLKMDPFSLEKYGDVYFSKETGKCTENFKLGIANVMENVEYFVMPLTNEYFDDFWDKENNCLNDDSITYKEIMEAMRVNSKFICVTFPDFCIDITLLKKIFKDNNDIIACTIKLEYKEETEQEIFKTIAGAICKDTDVNVKLSFKKDTEDPVHYPFYQRLYDVKSITLLNYASSAFITSIDTALIYKETDVMKKWFFYNLIEGNITANVIITDPYCSAARDAAKYKMYPKDLKMQKSEIILHNFIKLLRFVQNNPKACINIYITQIALPYGIMHTLTEI